MKILILEDNYERNQWFQKKFIRHQLFITTTAIEAIEALKRDIYDIIFLDHDLAVYHYDSYFSLSEEAYIQDCINRLDKETGMAVAMFLSEHPEISPEAQIIVHTQNTIGGPRMVRQLTNVVARKLLVRRAKLIPMDILQQRRITINA
jgi:CheY-like chemotaxis protein